MASPITRKLIVASILITSILAGLNFNRSFVEMPAWRRTGVAAWAAFSGHADLGFGSFWYPFLGFCGTLLVIAAAIAIARDRTAPRRSALATYIAAGMQIGGMVVTVKTAPFMESTPHLIGNPIALQRAFDGFLLWGNIRSAFQIAGFVAIVWALAALSSGCREFQQRGI